MKKKYKVIAKVESDKFVKYNVTNLVLFSYFLDRTFPNWRYFNVYEYTKDGSGKQIGNYTRNQRPQARYVPQ